MRSVEDLRGKTVLLTGASTGLRPHIARRLHQAGAKFVLSARSDKPWTDWPTNSASRRDQAG